MKLNNIIDKIKINKFAEAGLLSGIYLLSNGINKPDIIDGIFGGLFILISPIVTHFQNARYDRLIDFTRREGYCEPVHSLYMNSPCGRSLVKTVLGRTDNLDNYPKLKQDYPLTTILD